MPAPHNPDLSRLPEDQRRPHPGRPHDPGQRRPHPGRPPAPALHRQAAPPPAARAPPPATPHISPQTIFLYGNCFRTPAPRPRRRGGSCASAARLAHALPGGSAPDPPLPWRRAPVSSAPARPERAHHLLESAESDELFLERMLGGRPPSARAQQLLGSCCCGGGGARSRSLVLLLRRWCGLVPPDGRWCPLVGHETDDALRVRRCSCQGVCPAGTRRTG